MPTTKTLRYDDWSKGEWGELSPFNAPVGSFSGLNVIVYTSGFIGPRSGLHRNEPTSGSLGQGRVRGIWPIGRINKPLMINVEDRVYSTTQDNISLDIVTHVATLDAVPVDFIRATWYDPNGLIYFTNPEDSVYSINWTDNTLANVPVRNAGVDNAGTQTVMLVRDRLYAAGDTGTGSLGGQYVFVSAAADFSNFSGGETFQVGYFNAVRSMVESQNTLLFSCLEATNNLASGVGWYGLVGATPQGDLRRVNINSAAEGQSEVVNAETGNFYYFTGWSAANTDTPYLAVSNGAKFDDKSWRHLRLTGSNRFGYYNHPDGTLLYCADQNEEALVRVNDVWSRLKFEVPISGPIAPTEGGNSFLLTFGDVDEDVKVYEMLSRPDHPGSGVLDAVSRPGDDSDTPIDAYFHLPAYMGDGKEVRVRKVFVDFQKWNTFHTDINNEFTVEVTTFGQYNLPGGLADGGNITTQTWSENQDEAPTTGTLDRYVARIGQQGWAQGFALAILGMKGVAIRSITVEFDEQDAEGRTK